MFALHNKAEFNRSLFFSRFNCFYQLNLHMRFMDIIPVVFPAESKTFSIYSWLSGFQSNLNPRSLHKLTCIDIYFNTIPCFSLTL